MRIGLYSGSFNPVHCAHIALADWLVHEGWVDEVWLVRSPRNPLKVGRPLLDDGERLLMLELAVESHRHLRVSDIEDSLPQPNYTITTLRLLRERCPQHEFHLIVGGDNWEVFDRWREWEVILSEFHLIVYPRPGSVVCVDRQRFPRVRVADAAPQMDVSSTEIRYRAMTGRSLYGWVPDPVADYIKEKGFYR